MTTSTRACRGVGDPEVTWHLSFDTRDRGQQSALRKDRWRSGLTTEAAWLMLDFAFGPLGLHRIQAACGPDNLGSQAVLDKLGFTRGGRMRDHVHTNGAWRDSILYSTLDTEWSSMSRG